MAEGSRPCYKSTVLKVHVSRHKRFSRDRVQDRQDGPTIPAAFLLAIFIPSQLARSAILKVGAALLSFAINPLTLTAAKTGLTNLEIYYFQTHFLENI